MARTGFVFDMTPWKVRICDLKHADCQERFGQLIADLPAAPEPGRIPAGADHVHIVPKGSGERDAREEEKWRALLFGTARCDHARLQGDPCRPCGGTAINMAGTRIGTTHDKLPIVIPDREGMREIRNWVPGKRKGGS